MSPSDQAATAQTDCGVRLHEVTRGKQLVVLVGSKRALSIAVKNQRERTRHTRLAHRIRASEPGK